MKYVILALILLSSSLSFAGERLYEDIDAKVISSFGDSLIVQIDNVPKVFGDNLRVKIKNLYLPDTEGACDREKRLADTSRNLINKLLTNESKITLKNIIRSARFQLEADIILQDGSNLQTVLIESGLAVSNKDQARWCER